jgi:hypothetical protein
MTFANHVRGRAAERGGARFNFIVIALLIGLAAYSAYQYVPVAYKAYLFKDYMQETVNKAAYPPGQTSDWVTQQLRAAAKEYGVPPDMQVSVQNENGRLAARVTYTRPVQLPGYVYQYNFDHTALSSSFVSGQ